MCNSVVHGCQGNIQRSTYIEDTVWLDPDTPALGFSLNIRVMVHNVSGIHNCFLQGRRIVGT